jgi:hypothetical protein
MLKVNQPERVLYLAIPLEAYQGFFQSRFAQMAISTNNLKLIVYDSFREEIKLWIK